MPVVFVTAPKPGLLPTDSSTDEWVIGRYPKPVVSPGDEEALLLGGPETLTEPGAAELTDPWLVPVAIRLKSHESLL
jgi:hypothetical protein